MHRIAVIGTSCSGKSNLARELAHRLAITHVELDALYWGPNWTARPPAEFQQSLNAVARLSGWVVDGNYERAREVLWPHATDIVWLRYSLPLTLWRAILRSTRRILTREVLWHGNRETAWGSFFGRDSVVRWVWSSYPKRLAEFQALKDSGKYPKLSWIVLNSPVEAGRFLDEVDSR